MIDREARLRDKVELLKMTWRHKDLADTPAPILAQTVRKTQLTLVESEWMRLEPSHRESLRHALSAVATSHPNTVGRSRGFTRLMTMVCGQPWDLDDLTLVLNGQATNENESATRDLIVGEDLVVLTRRIQILLRHRVFWPAFKFTRFLLERHQDLAGKDDVFQAEYSEVIASHLGLTALFKDETYLPSLVSQEGAHKHSTNRFEEDAKRTNRLRSIDMV